MTKEDDEKILKAQIDVHKTMFTTFFTLTIAFIIGSWASWDFEIARYSLMFSAFITFIATFGFLSFYGERHKQYIDLLRRK